MLARLAAAHWRGAIVGPHGTGKTTLLEELARQLASRGFVPRAFTLRGETSRQAKRDLLAAVRSLKSPDFLLLDGAEQLSTREWLTLHGASAACAGCVLTLHRAGRLPTIFETAPTPALLKSLTAALSPRDVSTAESRSLFARHHGDLRACLRELYDQQAEREPAAR